MRAGVLVAAAVVASLPSSARASCGPTRLVVVSDSHGLTTFGDDLDAWASSLPDVAVESYTLGGSSPEWLLRGTTTPRGYVWRSCDGDAPKPRVRLVHRKTRAPILAELLREGTWSRQVVVLELGTNVPGSLDAYAATAERLVRGVAEAGAACAWIGPPTMRKRSDAFGARVYAAIAEGIRRASDDPDLPACLLVDSRPVSTYPPRGDGTHYPFNPSGIAAAKVWADAVTAAVARGLDLADPPERATEPAGAP